jgi:hypothetical protein
VVPEALDAGVRLRVRHECRIRGARPREDLLLFAQDGSEHATRRVVEERVESGAMVAERIEQRSARLEIGAADELGGVGSVVEPTS